MKILWLKSELLHPLDKGGRIRTYQMLRILKRNHHITYLTLDDGTAAADAVDSAAEYCTDLVRVNFTTTKRKTVSFFFELIRNVFSPLPYSIWKYKSEDFRRQLERQIDSSQHDLLVCDFLFPAVNLPRDLSLPSVIFQHNVEAEILRRHAEQGSNMLTRAYFRSQWYRMKLFEQAVCQKFDEVIAVSPNDRDYFKRTYGLASVSSIPTGVDTGYFRPTKKHTRDSCHLVFTGAMDWMPNEQGIVHFVQHVYPLIRAAKPETTLTIVGRNPGPRITSLISQTSIHVTGTVPDIRPYLERATVVIVPLQIGGGTRLKIFEAMAMGCPIVSTRIGAEGLPLRDGEHIRLADSPEMIADVCITLMNDSALAGRLGSSGQNFVRENFGCNVAANQFESICGSVVRRVSGLG